MNDHKGKVEEETLDYASKDWQVLLIWQDEFQSNKQVVLKRVEQFVNTELLEEELCIGKK